MRENLSTNKGFLLLSEIEINDSQYLSFGVASHVCFMYTSRLLLDIRKIYSYFKTTFAGALNLTKKYIDYKIEKINLNHILYVMTDKIRKHQAAYLENEKDESRKVIVSELNKMAADEINYTKGKNQQIVNDLATKSVYDLEIEDKQNSIHTLQKDLKSLSGSKLANRNEQIQKLENEIKNINFKKEEAMSQTCLKEIYSSFKNFNNNFKNKFCDLSHKYSERDDTFLDYIKMYEQKLSNLQEVHSDIDRTVSELKNILIKPFELDLDQHLLDILSEKPADIYEKDTTNIIEKVKPGLIAQLQEGVPIPEPQE